MVDTQDLIPTAERMASELPCLWLRGILPDKFTKIDDKYLPTNLLHIEYAGGTPTFGSGTYYGDASGGEYTRYPSLRRCGVGVCQVDENGELIWGMSSNLPGPVQTL